MVQPRCSPSWPRAGLSNPNRYYFRINLSFETAADHYKWLNNIIAVGSAIRLPQAVVYDAYAIR